MFSSFVNGYLLVHLCTLFSLLPFFFFGYGLTMLFPTCLGIESFSKLGDSIYFEEEGKVPGIYIIQFISSSLNWKSGQILLNQKVEPAVAWNSLFQVSLTISSEVNSTSCKKIYWQAKPQVPE